MNGGSSIIINGLWFVAGDLSPIDAKGSAESWIPVLINDGIYGVTTSAILMASGGWKHLACGKIFPWKNRESLCMWFLNLSLELCWLTFKKFSWLWWGPRNCHVSSARQRKRNSANFKAYRREFSMSFHDFFWSKILSSSYSRHQKLDKRRLMTSAFSDGLRAS